LQGSEWFLALWLWAAIGFYAKKRQHPIHRYSVVVTSVLVVIGYLSGPFFVRKIDDYLKYLLFKQF